MPQEKFVSVYGTVVRQMQPARGPRLTELVCAELGRVSVWGLTGRGNKKTGSGQRGIDLFVTGQFELRSGPRGGWYGVEAHILSWRLNLRSSWGKLQASGHLASFFTGLVAEEDGDQKALVALLEQGLDAIEKVGPGGEAWIYPKALRMVGLLPELRCCGACRRQIQGAFALAPQLGLRCQSCAHEETDFKVALWSRAMWAWLNRCEAGIAKEPSNALLGEVQRWAKAYVV